MSNFQSLFGAVKVNGKLIANPYAFFADANCSDIVWTRTPVVIKNAQGNDVTAFPVVYVQPQDLSFTTYYLPTHTGLTTLANFLSGLVAINATKNTFTSYSNLVKSSDQAQGTIAAGVSMLINDQFASRQYLAGKNQTVVSVNVKNRFSKTLFYFTGDQTYAGQYLYFKSTGNA